MLRESTRGSAQRPGQLTVEEIHVAVMALTRSLAHEVPGLMAHRRPSFDIYARLRDEAHALYALVDWVHEAALFDPEEEATEAAASS